MTELTESTPRTEVLIFSEAMERVLRKNDHKGGWGEMSLGEIFDRVQEEFQEAEDAWESVKKREHYEKVSEELVDVANFCMMFYNNLHPELRFRAPTPEEWRNEGRNEVLDELSREFIGKTESEIKDILFKKRTELRKGGERGCLHQKAVGDCGDCKENGVTCPKPIIPEERGRE